MPSIDSSTEIFILPSSNRGRSSMSMRSVRLSSKFADRQSIDAVQVVSRAPITMLVARKSSFSSSSAGARPSVPPVRMSSVVIEARPTLSEGSR